MQTILPPHNLSPDPDQATRKGLNDFTGKNAEGRVLSINVWFLKYGTDDKAHAAALLLSLILLAILIGVLIRADGSQSVWNDKVFSWLGSAFLLVAGIAIGKGGETPAKRDE